LQTKWDEPEDPKYLLPPPEPKDADFAFLEGGKAFASELGYRLRANAKGTLCVALKKLDTPITGTVTLRTKIRAVPQAQGLLRNGYLAFGDSTEEPKLIKCGVRLQPQTAAIIQGPFMGENESKTAKVEAPEKKGMEAIVTVALDAQKVTMVANGVTIEAQIDPPLKSITYVGYVQESALIDVAPIVIEKAAR
jgi:hypothetical protein